MSKGMFMIDFSRISATEFQRLHAIIETVSAGVGCGYNIREVADFLDRLKYSDMLELGSNARTEFGEIFDKLHIIADIDVHGLLLRHKMTAFLTRNDPNGLYTDDALLGEDFNPMTLKQAAICISNLED